MWAGFGFDSGVSGSFYEAPTGMGIHWSTLLKMSLIIYILMINYNVNGLKSFTQFKQEIKRDFKYIFRWRKHSVNKGQIEYSKLNSYMGSFRALFLSFCVMFIGLFSFEIPWTILYNYYQFGDLWYPIYSFSGSGIGMWRNFVVLGGAMYCYYFAVKLPKNTIMKLYHSYQVKFDKYSLNQIWYYPPSYKLKYNKIFYGSAFIMLSVVSFGIWIEAPQSHDLVMYHDSSSEIDPNIAYIGNAPIRDKFPQTIYTYYDVKLGEPYTNVNIGAYWVYDDAIHFLNVLTKTLVFLGVGLFFMVKVDKYD